MSIINETTGLQTLSNIVYLLTSFSFALLLKTMVHLYMNQKNKLNESTTWLNKVWYFQATVCHFCHLIYQFLLSFDRSEENLKVTWFWFHSELGSIQWAHSVTHWPEVKLGLNLQPFTCSWLLLWHYSYIERNRKDWASQAAVVVIGSGRAADLNARVTESQQRYGSAYQQR